MTLSLQTSVNNALRRESLTQIKERAPSQYYTQNRMVNGEDYTNFPFTQFNSIIKSKAVNRSSIGVSRNQDLVDPTGKYSSTNIIGDDGALYVSDTSNYTSFSTLNINIAAEFLSKTMPVFLSTPEVLQYYNQYFPRVQGYYSGTGSIDGKVYWKRITTASDSVTGYFYILDSGSNEVPIPVGSYGSSLNMAYANKGALLKFVAPAGKYFDQSNHLQTGTASASNGGRSFIWIPINEVVGDGYNFGNGTLSNGKGAITLGTFVPSGVYLDTTTGTFVPATKAGSTGIIPVFDNTLSADLVRTVLSEIALKTPTVYLGYYNLATDAASKWSYGTNVTPLTSEYIEMVRFEYVVADESYLVTFKNRTYYFGSVSEVKFLFDTEKKVFDQKSGKILSDFVNVFKSNSSGSSSLGVDYPLYITGQQIQSDGYPDDYAVKVSTIDINNDYAYSPDFFDIIVEDPLSSYVFFENFDSTSELYSSVLLPAEYVITAYLTLASIENIKYEYPVGSVFYASTDNKFYVTSTQSSTNPPIINVTESTNYSVAYGRSAINFQYRHNSNNTTRIDPATTNIIDLYLVTQEYYTQYQNWLNDTTGTVTEPERPTINQLQQSYGSLDNYKMISDSVIMNSVVFKPLFGPKAESALQGTIKVIKNPSATVSDSQIRSAVLTALNNYFTLDKWDFGDIFYFSELSAYLHVELAGLISSVVLVPLNPSQVFGDLYEIRSAPNEIFVNAATISDNIVVISALTPSNLQM
jgi:hypothetical protein